MEIEMKKTSKQTYKEYAAAKASKSPTAKNVIRAFFCGGSICLVGEIIWMIYRKIGVTEQNAWTLSGMTLIFLAVLLTGFGVFDKIAAFAGAGTLVPITGFANAMASPAMDARSEGYILGVGAKTFTVAGPVILYGTAASVLYGIIYWIVGEFVL